MRLGGLVERPALILGMQVEWMAVITVPMLAGLAASRAGPPQLRALAVLVAALAISYALHATLGQTAVFMYWLGGCLAYVGWAFEASAPERLQLLLVRWVVTTVALIPAFFVVVAASKLIGAEPMLVLGAAYFALLQVLEATGVYRRALRWYLAAREAH